MRMLRASMGVCLAMLALVGAGSVPSAAAPAGAPLTFATYRVVFNGSGSATSAYPPSREGTVFTSRLSWSLTYVVALPLPTWPLASRWEPARGSSVTGGSTGVATAQGVPIEPGCQHIGFTLDRTQDGLTLGTWKGAVARLTLTVPGFARGALLGYSPSQCASPFPTGAGGPECTDAGDLTAPAVSFDTSMVRQSWPLSGSCNIADQDQTENWSGTLTATRVSIQAERRGDVYFASGATRAKMGRVAVAPTHGRWSVHGLHCPQCGLIGYVAPSPNGRLSVYCIPQQGKLARIGFVVPVGAARWDAYVTASCPIPLSLGGPAQGRVGSVLAEPGGRWRIRVGYGTLGYVDLEDGGPAAGAALLLGLFG